MNGTHTATIVLYDCQPLTARMSKENCVRVHAKSRAVQFNNDVQGDPYDYEKCKSCKGVTGKGEEVVVSADGPPTGKALVPTLYGGWGYVG